MNKTVSLLLLINGAFVLSCNDQPRVTTVVKKPMVDTTVMSTHFDHKERFELLYPKGWDTTLLDTRALFIARDTVSANKDDFAENMNVMKTTLNAEPTMGELSDFVVQQLKNDYPTSNIRKRSIVETTGGWPYVWVDMAITYNGVDLEMSSAFYPRGKDLLMIYMMSDADDLPKYKQRFQQIMQQFSYEK